MNKKLMAIIQRNFILFTLVLISLNHAYSKLKIIGYGKGDYLSFSYDKNIFYGEKVELSLWDFKLKGERLLIDFDTNVIRIFGGAEIEKSENKLRGDLIEFSILSKEIILRNYKETMEVKFFDENLYEKPQVSTSFDIREIDAEIVTNSFLYYTFSRMEILENLRIIGYEVVSHLEGFGSVLIEKFVVKKGTINIGSGVRVGKVWYSNSQGVSIDISAVIKRKGKDLSLTYANYEERSFLKESDYKRVFRVRHTNTLPIGKNWETFLNADLDSISSWNVDLSFSKITPSFSSNFTINHFKSFSNIPSETWIKFDSTVKSEKIGNVGISLGYERKGQFLSSLSFSKTIWKTISLSTSSSYNFIKKSGVFEGSRMFSGVFSVRFSPKFLSLSSSYSLNKDLITENSLTTPSLNLEFSPIILYSRLIQINISNSFLYNIWRDRLSNRTDYTDNLVLNFSTSINSISLLRNISINYRLEHLWRSRGDEFLTSGAFFNLRKSAFKNSLNISLIYNFTTRRRTEEWFIEGNNFENMALFIDLKPFQPIRLNFSLNGEPKRGLVNSFANLYYFLGRGWFVELNSNYDFITKKPGNIEAYLVRETDKFNIRIGWRLLGRQLFIDLIPR